MITHHQMAVDISVVHSKNTTNAIIMKILRELIWTQQYEIAMMLQELNNKTENISIIDSEQKFIPTVSSFIYPNTIGLTNTYCDPAFFTSNHHNMKTMILTDKQYILHMIPHHQVAIDMCKLVLKYTKSDYIIYLAYRMIREQEAENILLNNLLHSSFITLENSN